MTVGAGVGEDVDTGLDAGLEVADLMVEPDEGRGVSDCPTVEVCVVGDVGGEFGTATTLFGEKPVSDGMDDDKGEIGTPGIGCIRDAGMLNLMMTGGGGMGAGAMGGGRNMPRVFPHGPFLRWRWPTTELAGACEWIW